MQKPLEEKRSEVKWYLFIIPMFFYVKSYEEYKQNLNGLCVGRTPWDQGY